MSETRNVLRHIATHPPITPKAIAMAATSLHLSAARDIRQWADRHDRNATIRLYQLNEQPATLGLGHWLITRLPAGRALLAERDQLAEENEILHRGWNAAADGDPHSFNEARTDLDNLFSVPPTT